MKGLILLIDDNPLDLKVASFALEAKGYACHGFTRSVEAFEWLKDHSPQLVFLDLQMPDVDGFDLIPVLRKLENTKDVPLIIMSGKNGMEDVKRAIQLGASDYVVKPLDPLVLQEKTKKSDRRGESDFHSIDLPVDDVIKADFARPLTIVSVSEFGVVIRSPSALSPGETVEIVGAPEDFFGKSRLLVRCLTCEAMEATGESRIQTTFVGMTEQQRQTIRKNCRQIWVQAKEKDNEVA